MAVLSAHKLARKFGINEIDDAVCDKMIVEYSTTIINGDHRRYMWAHERICNLIAENIEILKTRLAVATVLKETKEVEELQNKLNTEEEDFRYWWAVYKKTQLHMINAPATLEVPEKNKKKR